MVENADVKSLNGTSAIGDLKGAADEKRGDDETSKA